MTSEDYKILKVKAELWDSLSRELYNYFVFKGVSVSKKTIINDKKSVKLFNIK